MRRVMWFSIGFAAACAVGAWLLRGFALLIFAAVCLCGAAGMLLGRRYKFARPAAAVCLGCVVGCLWFLGFEHQCLHPAQLLDRTEQNVEIEACGYGWDTERGTAVEGSMEHDGKQYRVQLYLNEKHAIQPGDRIRTAVRLRFTDNDRPTHHRGKGILLLAYQSGSAEILPGNPGKHLPAVLRERCLGRIERSFPEDAAGFAKALVFGEKEDLSYATQTDFKVTGISHMVAVSGLHLSILFSAVYILAGKGRFLTPILGIPSALLFAAMVGFTPSVTRSAIMLSLMMLALALNREYDPPTALAFAALVMLMRNPLVITSVGFEMSVASVAGIFLFYSPIRGWLSERLPKPRKKKHSFWRALASSASLTLSATVLSAPLAAAYFGAFSLIGVLTNLLVLPVISFVFCGILVTCAAAALLPAAGTVMGWFLALPIRYVLGAAHLLGKLPLAAVYTTSPYVVFWLVFLYGMIFCLIFGRHRRPILAASLAIAGLGIALGCSYLEPLRDDYRVTALDVGQGQCVLLQSGANTFLVDCGGDYDEKAADLAAETLLGMGISRIDGLIISHYDRDHAGGAEYLAQRIAIDRAYLPIPQEPGALCVRVEKGLRSSEIVWLDDDLELCFGKSKIRIFAPRSGNSDNESCAAVLFQRGKYDTLITGDLPDSRERRLLEEYELPDLEVLVVGHHGSKTSTSQELLDRCAPDVAIISCGRHNSYGHPADEVLQRLEAVGCLILRTDRMGTVTYRR